MKCEQCGNEHDGSYGSGRFCSEKCKRSYCGTIGNLHRTFWSKPWNKGKHTKGHHHTKETREKLSEIRSKYLDSCKGGFKNVGWYKVKNLSGTEFTVRGHWEENVANKLTANEINWIRNRTLKYIKDGIRKTYNPDFYLPDTNEYVEVKGYYSDKDKEKMRLVLENNPGIKIYFIGEKQYKDFVGE